jgi:drug/metabolite transporter (DMT)-like permease
MLLGSFVFSIMSALAHALGDRVDWQVVAIARSGVAFVLALVLAVAGGARLVFLRPGMLWVRSLSGSVSLVCTFYALTHMPLAEVLTITNTGAPEWLPVAAAFGAAWSTALAMLGLNRLGNLDTRSVVAHFSAVATVVSVASLWIFPREYPEGPVWAGNVPWLLAGVGLTATAGQLCLTRAFTTGTASRVAVVGLSQVLFAAGIDWLVFSKRLNTMAMFGMALVLLPTAHVILQRAGKGSEK